jgi:hypothetical protein
VPVWGMVVLARLDRGRARTSESVLCGRPDGGGVSMVISGGVLTSTTMALSSVRGSRNMAVFGA